MTALRRRRLVRALSAADEATRWQAAAALSQVDDPRTLRQVERLLEGRGRDEGRAAAAYVLGFSGETDVSGVGAPETRASRSGCTEAYDDVHGAAECE